MNQLLRELGKNVECVIKNDEAYWKLQVDLRQQLFIVGYQGNEIADLT